MLVALAIAKVEGIKCDKETKLYLYDNLGQENLYTCSQTSIDKPARLSFSCSLDLLLISIKQI